MTIRGLIFLAHKAQGEQPSDPRELCDWLAARKLLLEGMIARGWMDESGHHTAAWHAAKDDLPRLIEEEDRAIAAAIPAVIDNFMAQFDSAAADAAARPTEDEAEAQP
jgi:hypothetical protein